MNKRSTQLTPLNIFGDKKPKKPSKITLHKYINPENFDTLKGNKPMEKQNNKPLEPVGDTSIWAVSEGIPRIVDKYFPKHEQGDCAFQTARFIKEPFPYVKRDCRKRRRNDKDT